MIQLRYPAWQEPYVIALSECDPEKLHGLIAAAESAMFYRCQALSSSPEGDHERQAIAKASNDLLIIKRDRLKFPGLDGQGS